MGGLYVKDEKHDSDIDSSDGSDQLYQDDEAFIYRQKRIEQTRKYEAALPMYDETNEQFMKRVYGIQESEEQREREGVQTSFWKRLNEQKQKKKKSKKKKKKNMHSSHIALSKIENTGDGIDEDDVDELDQALAIWADQ